MRIPTSRFSRATSLSATAESILTNQPLPCTPASSDAYTVAQDGRITSADGFIVPYNFAEFSLEFPNFIKDWVRARMPFDSAADREDRVSELNIWLMTLPEASPYRQPGACRRPDGITERIQMFDPVRMHGATRSRYRHFLSVMLRGAFYNLCEHDRLNPITRLGRVAFCSLGTPGYMDDDLLHCCIRKGKYDNTVYETEEMDYLVHMREIRDFINQYNPDLVPVLERLLVAGSFVDAQRQLGLSDQLFNRARARLEVLIECFNDKRKAPPRQRKVYRPRTRTTDIMQGELTTA